MNIPAPVVEEPWKLQQEPAGDSSSAAEGEARALSWNNKIQQLALPQAEDAGGAGGEARLAALTRLGELAQRPFVRRVAMLPDCHWKAKMELPSSVAVDCGDTIVPDVTSVAVNDCMSVLVTRWTRQQLRPELFADFFNRVNGQAARSRASMTRYSPSRIELAEILRTGAAGAARKFGLSSDILEAMERRGCLPVEDLSDRDLNRLVPSVLLRHRGFRAEFGQNFGGNHFLEVQAVGDVLAPEIARKWDLSSDQVVLMTHLGPGPFTGNLLHLYAQRQKTRRVRRWAYTALKAWLHLLSPRGGSRAARYRAYFGSTRFRGFPLDSEIGADLYAVMRLGCNFGFAYQLGCYQAAAEALAATAHEFQLPDPQPRLLWTVSHNHLWRESIDGAETFVGRHNAVRAYPGRPAIVAGNNDVDSCLGIGLPGGSRWLHSYDHGVGSLVSEAARSGTLPAIGGQSTTFRFLSRSPDAPRRTEVRSMRSRHLLEQVIQALEQEEIIQPVCYLQPLSTMHN